MLERVRQAVVGLGLGREAEVPVDDGALRLADGDREPGSVGAIFQNGETPADVQFGYECPILRVFFGFCSGQPPST